MSEAQNIVDSISDEKLEVIISLITPRIHKLAEAKQLNLSNQDYMVYILQYLEILMNGRVKPNTKAYRGGDATVRESKDECDEIAQIKTKLAKIFNLDTSIVYRKPDEDERNSSDDDWEIEDRVPDFKKNRKKY